MRGTIKDVYSMLLPTGWCKINSPLPTFEFCCCYYLLLLPVVLLLLLLFTVVTVVEFYCCYCCYYNVTTHSFSNNSSKMWPIQTRFCICIVKMLPICLYKFQQNRPVTAHALNYENSPASKLKIPQPNFTKFVHPTWQSPNIIYAKNHQVRLTQTRVTVKLSHFPPII